MRYLVSGDVHQQWSSSEDSLTILCSFCLWKPVSEKEGAEERVSVFRAKWSCTYFGALNGALWAFSWR